MLSVRAMTVRQPLKFTSCTLRAARARASELRDLVRYDETCHSRRRESRRDARNQRRQRQLADVAAARRRELSENTNLDTQGANVAKTAQRVRGNELRARREVLVVEVRGEIMECIVLVLREVVN